MKGDFSKWDFEEKKNFSGVLHQQGRVLLDSDWNAQTRITNAWQDQAGRDAIGPGVAAVPAEESDSFKVKAAEVVKVNTPEHVELDILPGRVWADGLLTYLTGKENDPTAAVKRRATYLGPPIQYPSGKESEIKKGIRDAVILEVWRETVNGFQLPEQLIEPALGGPDTTERVHTAVAFKLLRLGPTDRCEDLADKLKEDISKKGSLIVTLDPAKTIDGECPVEEGGGYTGFEHHFYRIEIARVKKGSPAMFKWSRFNGGLVGRGEFDAINKKVNITANFQAITTSGLSSFYLETVEYNKDLGRWNVTYGTKATLTADNELDLTGTPLYGSIPGSDEPVFFRLWDGIEPISKFPLSTSSIKAKTLENGIRLEFDNSNKIYNPGDYWTFDLRAGGIGNPPVSAPVFSISPTTTLETDLNNETNSSGLQTEFNTNGFPISTNAVVKKKVSGQWLITDPDIEETYSVKKEGGKLNVYHLNLIKIGPPEGIRYHRVPLAVLRWGDTTSIAEGRIEDCRRIFRPLTKQKICCSYTVGHEGDFPTIQEAVDKLPWWGGKICLMPGIHHGNVEIQGKLNIQITGCGLRTLVLPAVTGKPIFTITNSWFIAMEHMWLATFGGTAIEMDGGGWNEIGHNSILAYRHAIRISPWTDIVNGVSRSRNAFHYHIYNNVIRMLGRPGGDVAIHFVAEDGIIERNNIAVIPLGTVPPEGEERENGDPAEECVEPESIEFDKQYAQTYLNYIWQIDFSSLVFLNPFRALGGIQLGGNSWRVKVRDNKIFGGDGNGITLGTGSLVPVREETETATEPEGHTIEISSSYAVGSATLDNEGLKGITAVITGTTTRRDITEDDGSFGFAEKVPKGKYTVTIETPGYGIKDISSLSYSTGRTLLTGIEIKLKKVEIKQETSEPFAFLYEIGISNNKIAQVGLCGIGFPAVVSRPQSTTSNMALKSSTHMRMGNPVVGLNITGNHIKNCLQHTATAIAYLGQTRGFGGISLGMCEDLTIRENRIEDNGRDHRDPVCGIYAAYAAQADISDNHIINNGPLNAKADINILSGERGGIVLPMVTSITLAGLVKTNRPTVPPATEPMAPVLVNAVRAAAALGGYAVRIHDNLVKQPVGHALQMFALGPVSVANNQLVTDFVAPKKQRPLAGAVLITNYGQPHYIRRFAGVPLPSGSVIFSNNRIRLSVADCWTAQTIISADDVAYLGNHSDVMEEVPLRPILFNTMIGALTLRASENRLQEVIGLAAFAGIMYDVFGIEPPGDDPLNGTNEPKASLFSYGVFMNNTTNNQGNHCLLAVSVANKPVDSDNQVLVVPMKRCQGYQAWLNKYSRMLLPGFLKLGGVST